MKKIKPIKTRNTKELASFLSLSPREAIEIEVRSEINSKIISVVKKSKFTHAYVAELVESEKVFPLKMSA